MVYRVGIIGAGFIGKRFSNAFLNEKKTEIVAICDLDKNRAEILSKELGAEFYTDYHKMIDEMKLDIVYIGTPPKYHMDPTIYSLKNGVNVICEKPIAENFENGKKMIEATINSDTVTAINFPFRYSNVFNKLKIIIENKEIGLILGIEIDIQFPEWPRPWQNVQWLNTKEQGGAIREVGSHFIFALTEIFGKVISVTGIVKRDQEYLDEKYLLGILQLENGLACSIKIIIGGTTPSRNSLIIKGKECDLSFENWGRLYKVINGKKEEIIVDRNNSELSLVENFVKILDGKNIKKTPVSFGVAAHVQKVIDALLISQGSLIQIKE